MQEKGRGRGHQSEKESRRKKAEASLPNKAKSEKGKAATSRQKYYAAHKEEIIWYSTMTSWVQGLTADEQARKLAAEHGRRPLKQQHIVTGSKPSEAERPNGGDPDVSPFWRKDVRIVTKHAIGKHQAPSSRHDTRVYFDRKIWGTHQED